LTWSANDPTEGVVGYLVYRDDVEVEDTTLTTFDDTGLTAETSYSYTVTAYDANDNESDPSDALVVETEAA
jgi:chitodextrinase